MANPSTLPGVREHSMPEIKLTDHSINLELSKITLIEEVDEVLSTDGSTGQINHAPAKVATKPGEDDDDGWDTDLDEQDGNEDRDFDPGGKNVYIETCRELGVVPVSYFLRHMRESSLVMRHHGLGPLGAKAIAIPLVSNTTVLKLDLEDNWLEGEGGVYMADMLKENCYISDLNLSENRLGSVGAAALCEMLAINISVTSLRIAGNNFTDNDGLTFAAAILENNRVRVLDLSHNNFGEVSGEALGHAIGENETIKDLDLSWNNFRLQGGIALLDGIRVNSCLKKVNLSWNGLGNEGALAVAELLRTNDILSYLDLTSNRITLEGVMAVARGLESNETLKVLKLGRNPIPSAGALVLLSSIYNERSILEELDLSDILVEKEFLKLQEEVLENRKLKIIHGAIVGNYVIKFKAKKPALSEESVQNLLAQLEDPVGCLRACVNKHNIPLVDKLLERDPDHSYRVLLSDFKAALKEMNIGLNDDQLDALGDRLDKAAGRDGMIDYSCLTASS